MKARRLEKAKESFKREISNIIMSMKDPRIYNSFITISRVDVSGDLSFCKVFVSSIRGNENSEVVCKILNNASGYIQNLVSKRLKTRIVPKLLFISNPSEEYAFKLEKIINRIKYNSFSSLLDISDFLKKNDNFEIYTHEIPDGDAIASCSALYLALKQMGKKVRIIYDDKFPRKFEFVNHLINYENDEFVAENFICLDVCEVSRIGAFNGRKFDICLDHHAVDSCDISDRVYINKKASACSEILYDLFKVMNININQKIATCIYIGIVSDTGRFKFSNISTKVFKIMYEIFNKIENVSDINFKISDQFSKNFVEFQSDVMKNFEYFGSTCVSFITLEMMKKYGIEYQELDPIYKIPLKIEGIDLGIIVKQRENELFKVSARSLDNGKALKFCKLFDGGGHSDAAGFEIHENLELVKNKILKKIENFRFL